MNSDSDPAGIRVTPTPTFFGMIWVGFPVVGGVAGWLLSHALEWILDLGWAPFQGPLQAIDDVTGTWTTVILTALGFFVGVVVAFSAYGEIEFVTVDPQRVTITLDGEDRFIERSSVAVAFIEAKSLVLQDAAGRQHPRAKVPDLPPDRLRDAFSRYGYVWAEADPRSHELIRWERDSPTMPTGADAILAARQSFLETGKTDDAEELRVELSTMGVVVHDDKKTQYWRPVA